jgi:hypothetical protein
MRPELAAFVDWLRSSGRMAEVDYGRLLHEVIEIGQWAAFMAGSRGHVDPLTNAGRTIQMHLRAAIIDHDPAALALLLEGLIPLARFVGDNPIRLLVATDVLTDEEIDAWVDAWVDEAARRNPPPTGPAPTGPDCRVLCLALMRAAAHCGDRVGRLPVEGGWHATCTTVKGVGRTEGVQGVDSMATRPDTTRETVNQATSEAMRATSEASRRTLQSAQDAMRTTRAYLQESTEGNRKLFNAYARGIEAAIKGGFEVQNALMAASMSFLDASTNSSRNVVQQWTEATQQAQQAALEVWQASAGAGDRLLASTASGEMSGQEDKERKR